MAPILEIAADAGLKVIEDAAQAHGAEYKGRRAGSIGDFGTFSFFPGKNLGAYGDAGMVTTQDADSAERLRMMRNHGRTSKFEHEFIGYNYRLDALQAAILQVKLRHLDEWIEARRRIAHRYNALLADAPVQTPVEVFGHVYHLYVIQCDDRDALATSLGGSGVATGMHYPVPLHLQPCFAELPTAGRGRLPVTEALVDRILSLPIYAELTEEMQGYVVDSVLSGLAG
jgi:dTDP-4-amino-4,6-dideoxygalactose transaminase